MPKIPEEKSGNPFWDFFSSVRLTIVLLILLAIASIAGTLIPQREEAARWAHEMSPGLVQLFSTLQLFDVYHSFWFRILIAALALNLVICSLDRFPVAWKRFKGRDAMDRSSVFKNVSPERVIRTSTAKNEVTTRVAEWMRGSHRSLRVRSGDQEDLLFAEKGRYSYFGVYITHLSVLLILVGGMVGSFFGFEAHVNIPEGSSVDSVFLRRSGEPIPLGFSVRCEKFTVNFYPNGSPKEYRSEISFVDGGQVVQAGSLLVNHPMTFKGITFYQASYGSVAGERLTIRIRGKGDEETLVTAQKGQPFELPGKDGTAVVSEVRPDLMRLGPAAQVQINPSSGEPLAFWIFLHQEEIGKKVPGLFERSPRFNFKAYEPYSFFMKDLESKHYTGLQVNKDPGVPLVWAGFLLMVIGFFMAFFASHRRIWVKVSGRGGKTSVTVVGRSSKNPAAMDRELDRITTGLQDLTK